MKIIKFNTQNKKETFEPKKCINLVKKLTPLIKPVLISGPFVSKAIATGLLKPSSLS